MFFEHVIDSADFLAPQAATITFWYNLLVYWWFVQFVMGCQHTIVAGAVGKWYFTRYAL
jgi:solute carrier family 44 (choline transporter-like protein), member 1